MTNIDIRRLTIVDSSKRICSYSLTTAQKIALVMLVNLCARGLRGQYHDTPKRRSTRCPRHLNSANRELDLRELSHVEAGIRYIYTLLSLTQNVRLSLGVALLPDSASHSVKQNPLADTRIPI